MPLRRKAPPNFSHREIELSSGEEFFLVFQVCLHKQQGSNVLFEELKGI
jgi:hypothetical protein